MDEAPLRLRRGIPGTPEFETLSQKSQSCIFDRKKQKKKRWLCVSVVKAFLLFLPPWNGPIALLHQRKQKKKNRKDQEFLCVSSVSSVSVVKISSYCCGAKYPLRARTCRSFFNAEISMER
jgi:hypothetical protein